MSDRISLVLNQLKISTPENADWVLDRFREELGAWSSDQVALLQQEATIRLEDSGFSQEERDFFGEIYAVISYVKDFPGQG